MDTNFKVDLQCETNNKNHHTDEIRTDWLIVRRGQAFAMQLLQPFNPSSDQLLFTASTGEKPEQDRGTLSVFGIPDSAAKRSESAKAVWKVEVSRSSTQQADGLSLDVTPPADAPIGKYTLSLKMGEKEGALGELYVLFNPWCPDDSVFMCNDKKRQEYVMNEEGLIYKGSCESLHSACWDFGQFDEEILEICLTMLDRSPKHKEDPAADVSARCDPIYVSRVISAMVNSEDDNGVLEGCWDGNYSEGIPPTYWSSSSMILNCWVSNSFRSIKYGQCWVFGAVMCTVMRCLGIPCRVVTNFDSAYDSQQNLTIDIYRCEEGATAPECEDSIWNFHVWTEGWMTRPDLTDDGKYDGWQVLDPTPQDKSGGVYCCGPAPVKAILNGDTDMKYDVPFVFAEVNADIVFWLVKADGSKVQLKCNNNKVGHKISTKCVGSNRRHDVTRTYKYKDGSKKERETFKQACSRDYCKNGFNDSDGEEAEEEMECSKENGDGAQDEGDKEKILLQFEEVSKSVKGQDVDLKLLLHSNDSAPCPVSINITVKGMKYTCKSAVTIQTEVKEGTLQHDEDLSIPIQIPFSVYGKPMVDCDSMKVSVTVTEKDDPENIYLLESNISLEDPPLHMTLVGEARKDEKAFVEVLFKNETSETLKNCCLTICGNGLLKDHHVEKVAELKPDQETVFEIPFTPRKAGKKTLIADLDCSMFRDIKGSLEIVVHDSMKCH